MKAKSVEPFSAQELTQMRTVARTCVTDRFLCNLDRLEQSLTALEADNNDLRREVARLAEAARTGREEMREAAARALEVDEWDRDERDPLTAAYRQGARSDAAEEIRALPLEASPLRTELEAARAQVALLSDAIERDAIGMSQALGQIRARIRGATWLLDARGPYEWDDDRYKDEAGQAMRPVLEIAERALSSSGYLLQSTLRDITKAATSWLEGVKFQERDAARTELEDARAKLMDAENKRGEALAHADDREAQAKALNARLEDLTAERDDALEDLTALRTELEALRASAAAPNAMLSHLRDTEAERDAALKALRDQENATVLLQARCDAAERERNDLRMAMGVLGAKATALQDRAEAAETRAEHLEKFKAYTHRRLDEMGVPADPDPERNARTGCRLECRLDWLVTNWACSFCTQTIVRVIADKVAAEREACAKVARAHVDEEEPLRAKHGAPFTRGKLVAERIEAAIRARKP